VTRVPYVTSGRLTGSGISGFTTSVKPLAAESTFSCRNFTEVYSTFHGINELYVKRHENHVNMAETFAKVHRARSET
jgi:hypothetical protein